MAYELTKNNIEMFNEKYGVNINLSTILSDAKKTSPNEAVISAFKEAYKKVVVSDLGKDAFGRKSQSMFKDFSELVIDGLNWDMPQNKKQGPDKNAGLNKLDQYHLMEEAWSSLPENAVDAVAENYKSGNIRIRDMVAEANREGNLTNDQLKTLASYAEALKKVNEGRSFIWKVFHPVRNNAEKRDAKLIEKIATEKTNASSYKAAVTEVNNGLANFPAIKEATMENTLGVKNINDYVPEPELSSEELKSKEIQDWIEKYEGKGLEFFKEESKEFEKEALAIRSLEENPYANNEENQKIEEAPVIENPALNK